MNAPERIFASLATVHQCQGKWECVPFEIAPDSPQYILATPEALAASPEVATLIAETRREGWNVAIEASAALVEGSVYTSNGGDCTLEPALPKMRGMDMHHATISAAIRALKEETP